jgi:hypothetical protein
VTLYVPQAGKSKGCQYAEKHKNRENVPDTAIKMRGHAGEHNHRKRREGCDDFPILSIAPILPHHQHASQAGQQQNSDGSFESESNEKEVPPTAIPHFTEKIATAPLAVLIPQHANAIEKLWRRYRDMRGNGVNGGGK